MAKIARKSTFLTIFQMSLTPIFLLEIAVQMKGILLPDKRSGDLHLGVKIF